MEGITGDIENGNVAREKGTEKRAKTINEGRNKRTTGIRKRTK
jgi:hypothetical protein